MSTSLLCVYGGHSDCGYKDCTCKCHQGLIVDAEHKVQLSRISDPITSHEAAASLSPKAMETIITKVVTIVKLYPGVIREEIAIQLGDPNWDRVGKRLSDAERLNLIFKGAPRKATNGRKQSSWWPISALGEQPALFS